MKTKIACLMVRVGARILSTGLSMLGLSHTLMVYDPAEIEAPRIIHDPNRLPS